MSSPVLQWIITLGVPGLALYVFYLLLRQFGFVFRDIEPLWSAIIAIVFLLVVGFIVYHAIEKFAPPANGKSPEITHSGELSNLITFLSKDADADASIRLTGTEDEQKSLERLFVQKTAAPTYSELISKICAAQAACISCTSGPEGESVFEIRLEGTVAKSCEDADGEKKYCCVTE